MPDNKINLGNTTSGRDSGSGNEEFTVFTHVEVARRSGDRYYMISQRATSVDCSTRDEADSCFNTLEKMVSEEVKQLRHGLESTTGNTRR